MNFINDWLPLFNIHNYFHYSFSLIPIFAAAMGGIFCYLLYRMQGTALLTRALGFVFLSAIIWLLGLGFMLGANNEGLALFWSNIMYLGMALVPVGLFYTASAFVSRITYLRYGTVALLVWAFSSFFRETHLWMGMETYTFGFYPQRTSLPIGFLYFIVTTFALGIMVLIYSHFLIEEEIKRRKIRFFIISYPVILCGYIDLIANVINLAPIGFMAILAFMTSQVLTAFHDYQARVDQRIHDLEYDVDKKTAEISHVVGELRTTQLKLLETGKISAVASLSAGILHQISQPITAIHGFVKFIKKEMKPEDAFYKPICLMEEQSQYLKEMLEDLMELIRHREIKKENINVNIYINRAVNLITDELRIRRVNWDLVLEDNLPPVFADGVHLQQVFMNVIINATQALSTLPRGTVRYLKISSEFNRGAKKVLVSFQDNGPGLLPEDKQHIFEPFFSTKTKGAGIGLALCKDLIDEHGGRIEVESTPGHGATFVIQLPYVEVPQAA